MHSSKYMVDLISFVNGGTEELDENSIEIKIPV